jgi:hypothetical protein
MQSIKSELNELKEILWGMKDPYKILDVTLNEAEIENLKKVKNERRINNPNNIKNL